MHVRTVSVQYLCSVANHFYPRANRSERKLHKTSAEKASILQERRDEQFEEEKELIIEEIERPGRPLG